MQQPWEKNVQTWLGIEPWTFVLLCQCLFYCANALRVKLSRLPDMRTATNYISSCVISCKSISFIIIIVEYRNLYRDWHVHVNAVLLESTVTVILNIFYCIYNLLFCNRSKFTLLWIRLWHKIFLSSDRMYYKRVTYIHLFEWLNMWCGVPWNTLNNIKLSSWMLTGQILTVLFGWSLKELLPLF